LVNAMIRCSTTLLHLIAVPTTQPRYTVTDSGDLRRMLDVAQRRWPEVRDRRQLLLLLAAAGHEAIAGEFLVEERSARRDRQRAALARSTDLVETETLLADAAWQ
jgi:hypothetical protein